MSAPLKEVTKDEFDRFISAYPRPLSYGVTRICEPPMGHYYDEQLPSQAQRGSVEYSKDTEAARVTMDWMGPNGQVDEDGHQKFWRYEIRMEDA